MGILDDMGVSKMNYSSLIALF